MEEGATNQEAHEGEIRVLPPRSEPEAGSQPTAEATINPKVCVQTTPFLSIQTLC